MYYRAALNHRKISDRKRRRKSFKKSFKKINCGGLKLPEKEVGKKFKLRNLQRFKTAGKNFEFAGDLATVSKPRVNFRRQYFF
jgi:hypothetical protein